MKITADVSYVPLAGQALDEDDGSSSCGTKLLMVCCGLATAFVLWCIDIPLPAGAAAEAVGRPARRAPSVSRPGAGVAAVERELQAVEARLQDVQHQLSAREKSLEQARAQAEEEEEQKQCIVCMDKPRGVLLVPCGHFSLCKDCSGRFDACPSCNTHIATKVNVFVP